MTKVRILMLDLKSYYRSPAYQLGLLAAYAKTDADVRKNAEFSFLEFARERQAEQIAASITQMRPELVAVSNYAWNHIKICRILHLLEQAGSALPRIVLGGPNSEGSFGEEMLARHPAISALVEGEGEPAFLDICRRLVDSPTRDPFVQSRNCVVRDPNGGVARPNSGHRIESLDEVPSPYLTGILPVRPSPLFYETDRGCPYRCSFCYWGNGNARVYRMSIQRIREEMEFFGKNRVSSFWLADANFGIFPSAIEIAEIMCEVNERYGYPFKHVGVNWAKNCSERVLEIASIFRRGRMGCTTTLALQTVTGESERRSRRYSMPSEQFVKLIRSAHERNIDTYTDIIWGLPGETVEQYLNGLDAVISTGVPAILIHQLYLLPGTEFYDRREELGLKLLDAGQADVPEHERSDYWDYIVVSHPHMTREQMRRGTRILGINHLLHNHDLGRVVDFYLARHGIRHREIYDFFDSLLLEDRPAAGRSNSFFRGARELILDFAERVGLDEFVFYRRLSDVVWYRQEPGAGGSHEPEVRAFMHEFYQILCEMKGLRLDEWERDLLHDLVDYNVIISPKPGWQPRAHYEFRYDVHAVWQDMLTAIHRADDSSDAKGNGVSRSGPNWRNLGGRVAARLSKLLSNEYLLSKRSPTRYKVSNPWMIPPNRQTSDWLLGSRSKHCVVHSVPLPLASGSRMADR